MRSTRNLTKKRSSLRLAQSIAESSLLIQTRRASISSNPCSFDLESLLASYYDVRTPIKHQANRICKSVLAHEYSRYAATVAGAYMVSSKYLWRAALQEIFNNCSSPISFASEDITVPYSFRFRLEFSVNSCRYSCMAFFSLQAIKCPLAEFLALSIST